MEKHSPVSLVTKGTMIVRDVDVLSGLSGSAGCTVCVSVTTLDEGLWRRLEPGTPPPLKRIQAMGKLVQAGVNAGVLMAPIIPGITDGLANLGRVAQAASEHGARFLGGSTLYLKEGTKEHFLGFLESEYPGLVRQYGRLYPGAYAPRQVQHRLQGTVEMLKRVHRLSDRPAAAPVALQRGQLRLAL
jgi:DNA repair photolyase